MNWAMGTGLIVNARKSDNAHPYKSASREIPDASHLESGPGAQPFSAGNEQQIHDNSEKRGENAETDQPVPNRRSRVIRSRSNEKSAGNDQYRRHAQDARNMSPGKF